MGTARWEGLVKIRRSKGDHLETRYCRIAYGRKKFQVRLNQVCNSLAEAYVYFPL